MNKIKDQIRKIGAGDAGGRGIVVKPEVDYSRGITASYN
jgi:hypothetical protein